MPEPEFRAVMYRGRWAVEWYEDGKRFRHSLRTDNRADVPRAFAAFRAEWDRKQQPEEPTVEWIWHKYRESLGDKPAAMTMLYEAKAVLPFFGLHSAGAMTEERCLSYIAMRRNMGRSDGTIWTELGRLRSALKYAERKGWIAKAPHILRPERPPPRDKRLTREQARAFLNACVLPHVKLFVVLALTTGARMAALLDLTWDRVDFERSQINLEAPGRPKSAKGRALVPMNQTARTALLEAQRGATSQWVIEWAGHRVWSVKKALKSAGRKCGLPFVTAHVFRHSCASMLAESGVSMEEIAQMLGHSDVRVTYRIYAKMGPSYLQKAASALEL